MAPPNTRARYTYEEKLNIIELWQKMSKPSFSKIESRIENELGFLINRKTFYKIITNRTAILSLDPAQLRRKKNSRYSVLEDKLENIY